MRKRTINNIAGVGIIYRESDPREIFLEIKDDGLPIKVFRRGLCPIGGNWIGEAAKKDADPCDTFRREFNEEINFGNATASTCELGLLGFMPENRFYRTPRHDRVPTAEEEKMLAILKRFIASSAFSFADYIITVPKRVLNRDPQNRYEGYSSLVSYWLVPLPDAHWEKLVILQRAFGNLSNESISTITSLDEIVEKGIEFAYGHDRPFRDFFCAMKLPLGRKMPLVNGITCRRIGKPLLRYSYYLSAYKVKKRP